MKKYNIALLPKSQSQEFISIAKNFSNYVANYILDHNSLPHVTICHFEAEEGDIDQIWHKISEKISTHNLELTFNEFSCITFDNKTHWASLLPDNLELLFGMHETASNILGKEIKPNYDPHLTLFNTLDSDYVNAIKEYEKSYMPLTDGFLLTIGLRDDAGQYLKILNTI